MFKQKILIIDNDECFLTYLKKILGDDFITLITKEKDNVLNLIKIYFPDLIILGFLNPRGESFKLHRELCNNPLTYYIPQLVIDVKLEEHTRKGWNKEEGRQLESIDYISRPVKKDDLINILKRCFSNTYYENLFNNEFTNEDNSKYFIDKKLKN